MLYISLVRKLSPSKVMNHLSRHDRLSIFGKTIDRVIEHLGFKTGQECNAIARVLEARARGLRFRADELLSKNTEVPRKNRALRRSAVLIASDGERLSSIALE